jgi:hemoglobin-like flavoprotein
MSKQNKQTQTITLDNVEYKIEDMTDEQKAMLNHINDLGNKLNSMNFNRDQIQFGHDSFVKALKESLDTVVTEDA